MKGTLVDMPKYESYKDSGIDWIGDIPEHWELKPFRSLFHFRNEKNDPIKTENILSLSIAKGITEYTEEGRGGNKRKDDLTAYKLAYPGDIVLNSMNIIVGAVGLSRYFGAISPVYYALYIRSENSNLYYCERAFLDESFQKGLLRHGKGIMMKLSGTGKLNTIRMKVSTNDLKKIYFPFPPKEEQDKIVEFLDKKTSQIDKAIEIKEKQIALLKERKQIIIQNAVTKGLDPNVRMKDSGVEWIGEIPEHWEVRPLRFIGASQNGVSKGGDYFGSGFPFVSYGDVYNNISLPREVKGVAMSSLEDKKQYSVSRGDVFFTRTSETIEEIGFSSTCLNTIENAVFSGFLIRFRPYPNILASNYSKYYFSSEIHRTFFIKEMNLVTRASLSQDLLKQMPVLIPPIEEQVAIASYLDDLSNQISTSISFKEQEITKLKEYKASLINNAVTGKIKVV